MPKLFKVSFLILALVLICSNSEAAAPAVICPPTVMSAGNGTDLCAPFIAGATASMALDSALIATGTTDTAANTSMIVDNTGFLPEIQGSTAVIASNTSQLVARNTAKDAQDKLNWLQTMDAYAKSALELQEIIIQTELLVKDIEENPLQVIVPDANQLLANQAQINTIAQQIGQGSGAMSQNLMNNLQHPQSIGLGQGTTFELWSEARAKAVDEALSTAKFLASDAQGQNASFLQLVKNITSAQGPSMAAKNAAEAGKQQVQIAQKTLGAINQILMLQSTDAGAKVASDMSTTNDAVSANTKLWGTDPLGHPVVAHDTYAGPGVSGQGKAF